MIKNQAQITPVVVKVTVKVAIVGASLPALAAVVAVKKAAGMKVFMEQLPPQNHLRAQTEVQLSV